MSVHTFPVTPSRRSMHSATSWREHIDRAQTEKEVLILVRDFVARVNPADLALLPQECRPGKFFEAADVAGYALDLMRHHFTNALPGAAVELIAFFSYAAQRLSLIAGTANDHEQESRMERPS